MTAMAQEGRVRVQISPEPFDPAAALTAFAAGRDGCGALASFVGYCRAVSGGVAVTGLALEHYPGFTERAVEAIAHDVAGRFAPIDVLVRHRYGEIRPGEPIVLAAALSVSRAPAFAAVEMLMDLLKTDAPFWKHETGPDGARWVAPTAEDRARAEAHRGRLRP